MSIRAVTVATLCVFISGFVACAGGEPEPAAPKPQPSASAPPPPAGPTPEELAAKKKAEEEEAAKKKADEEAAAKKKADEEAAKKAEQEKSDLISAFSNMNGKFMFAYDKSEAFKKAKDDDCAKKNKDEKKKEACMKAAADEAARMGVRMSKSTDAKTKKDFWYIEIYTADAKGKEMLMHKFEVTASAGGASVDLKVGDKTRDMGSPVWAMKTPPSHVTVSATDGKTLNVEAKDWALGKLVFHKS